MHYQLSFLFLYPKKKKKKNYVYVKIASNTAEQSCINQATKVAGDAALADEMSSDQATKLASEHALISTEVLEVIEAMPHHEFFIQEH